MRYLALCVRTSLRSQRRPFGVRALYSRNAEYITINPEGFVDSRIISVWLGNPHEASTLIPMEIDDAFSAARPCQTGLTSADHADMCPSLFYHDTHHFAHGTRTA